MIGSYVALGHNVRNSMFKIRGRGLPESIPNPEVERERVRKLERDKREKADRRELIMDCLKWGGVMVGGVVLIFGIAAGCAVAFPSKARVVKVKVGDREIPCIVYSAVHVPAPARVHVPSNSGSSDSGRQMSCDWSAR